MASSAPPSKTSFNLSPKNSPFGAIRVGRKPKRTSSVRRTSASTPPFGRGRRSRSLGGDAFPYPYTEYPTFASTPSASSTGSSFFRRLASRFRSGKAPPSPIDTQLTPPVIPAHSQSSLPNLASAKAFSFRSPKLRVNILPSPSSASSAPLTPPGSNGPESFFQRATEAERFRTWTFARTPTPTTSNNYAQYPYTPSDSEELLPPPAIRDPAMISLPASPGPMDLIDGIPRTFEQPRHLSFSDGQLAVVRDGRMMARSIVSSPSRVTFGDHGSTFIESGLFDDDDDDDESRRSVSVFDRESSVESLAFEPRAKSPVRTSFFV
ncbi:hypothetical protein BOTBODRAFT_189891 [Botryobasidium botryosum FD-172 SS1]|uniref:Uncharacterized protein n=1 Tax=Botryobasidium botryosum (strain FD-172 SS1) TaxID=930990 RepID=A0A067MIH8_BOTB1|nr:hypothetical protein BOTBODRAFT_189891 [Botryobasidium botryosum FD-172 SS1]